MTDRSIELAAGRRLHFGCGPNKLAAPWENFDRDVNIAQHLPFEDGCASLIFAEHVIEHVPFRDGMAFLFECRRVLAHGGRLRLCFPDVTRITLGEPLELFLTYLKHRRRRAEGIGDVFRFILTDSGHQAAWTKDIGSAALAAVGFGRVVARPYGESELAALSGIDGHHRTSPVALIETTVLEATK